MSNCTIESDNEYVKLSDKNGVNLYMLKENDKVRFKLIFQLVNPNYDLNRAIGFKLFGLMAELNKDVIESISLSPYTEETREINMTLLFCRFGADFGLAQKYIYSNSTMINNGKTTTIITKQETKPSHISVPSNSEPASGSLSKLELTLVNNHKGEVIYDFILDLEEDVPLYMEKVPGKLMHKVFSRVKHFIESLV
jgi:hypothetical protein